MLRVDGAYLYKLGLNLRAINALPKEDTPRIDVLFELIQVKSALSEFVNQSLFRPGLRVIAQPAQELYVAIDAVAPDLGPDVDYSEVILAWQLNSLKTKFSSFETILIATLQTLDLYYVSQKGGFDTSVLTDNGENLFPASLVDKVPDSIADVAAATRCLAFELPTAAAFHLHRANEAVLRKYFDHLAGASHRPASGNMGEYINVLKTKKLGDPKVLDVLRGIKDLHRNPLMHPDDSIKSIDEAISLYAAIRAAIGYMLDRIEGGQAPVIEPLPLEMPEQSEATL
jgi:hypothetical protein